MFTSIGALLSGDFRLMGRTSLYMFPIYGLGALLGPIDAAVDRWLEGYGASQSETVWLQNSRPKLSMYDKFWRHGVNDMVLIFTAEYVFGFFLTALGVCPWDYSGRLFHVDGLIRLDFAPLWFGVGLFFEAITKIPEGTVAFAPIFLYNKQDKSDKKKGKFI